MSRTPVPVDGRTAFVSGAASGIGRAVARRLAKHGCPVAIADQDEAGLEQTAGLIGGPVLSRRLDVRDRQAQLAFAAEVAEWAPGPLGMVFNNAGVTTTQGVAEGSVEDDEWVTEINYGGVVNGIRAFLPILLRQDSGVIVNTSSVFGLMGWPFQSAYCATKCAGAACVPSRFIPAGTRRTSCATRATTPTPCNAACHARISSPSSRRSRAPLPSERPRSSTGGSRRGRAGSSSGPTPCSSMRSSAWHRRATSTCWP